MSFAQVALPLPLKEPFDYAIPEGMSVRLGQRVLVPLGRRKQTGVVVGLLKESSVKGMKAILEVLDPEPILSPALLKFTRWIADYYLCGWGEALALTLPPLMKRRPKPAPEKALPAAVRPFALNEAQARAAEAISQALQAGHPEAFLLRGITGSGKTEVYLDALDTVVGLGGSAIVLVPEIALTPQTWSRFEARFPGQVVVLHSGLSAGERARGFARLLKGEAKVALGPRSALFAPVQDLRLIIVDEESEPSYKQENAPRYHARDAALVRAKMEGAVAVLGSATPSFEAYHNAHSGKLTLLELPDRIGTSRLPQVRFIDLLDWDKQGSAPDDALAPDLVQALEENLAKGEQSLLFLNRRGFAPVWACAACGQAVQCDQCSISQTLHRNAHSHDPAQGTLRCHLCGNSQKPPKICPNPLCKKPLLRAVGAGTQRLEEEVKRIFPQARVRRVDRDTATGAGFHAELGDAMRAGEVDILLGTQMLAKGLDFPDLTLVGVVNADTSLSFPDFRSGERTFQLLVQVAGRAGRGQKKGLVLIQTRQTEHPCLQFAAKQDFGAYYKDSIDERRELGYPPFGRLAALVFRSKDKDKALEKADEAARALSALIQKEGLAIQVLGPAPSPLVLVKGWWRYRLLLKSRSSQSLHRLLDPWAYQWKDHACFLAVDLDPVSFL
jgi:primosomal protein N' (replication factor Y)